MEVSAFAYLRTVAALHGWRGIQCYAGAALRFACRRAPVGIALWQSSPPGANMTDLDHAHAAMAAGDDAAGRQFYRVFADATVLLLLDHEPEGERINPRVFDLADGPVVLCFDTDERLAGFGDGPLPYAALPGRIIAQHLAGQGVSLGLNLGTGAASETLLPPEALRWLADMLDTNPEQVQATPEAFYPPRGLPTGLADALTFTLEGAAGLALAALLVQVRYVGGRRGHMLAVIDAAAPAQPALARALGEALQFSGVDLGEIDVTFLASSDPAVPHIARAAQVFAVPAAPPATPPGAEPARPAAPGSNPDKPPNLR